MECLLPSAGGIKEKLIAAHHNGITRVLIPARNISDVEHEVRSRSGACPIDPRSSSLNYKPYTLHPKT